MSQEETSRKNKEVKGKQYMQAGKLTSMAYKRISSLRTKEHLKSLEDQVLQVRRKSSTLKAQVVQERGQQLPMDSSTVVAQVAVERLQQAPRDSSTLEVQDVQDQVQQEALNSGENELSGEQGPLTQRKKRGNTTMQSVHTRRERKLIVLNADNQPIGPTKAIVTELGSFLGTLARNAMLCPLNIHNWKNMDTKEDLWEYTLEKYNIPEAAKKWTLKAIQAAHRKYKNDLYRNHYKAFDNDDLRMKNKPEDVSEYDFKDLLKYWDSENFKKMSETNTKNRKKWKNPHTAGKTSFAVIRNILEKEKETSGDLSLKEIFVATRARKPNRAYKDSNEDTLSKIAEMEKIQSQQNENDSELDDSFAAVMGPEHPGRLRLYGRGVTKTTLKRKGNNFEPHSSVTDERMQKRVEELEERLHQVENLEQQKATIHQEVVVDILGKLKSMFPALQMDADMLAELMRAQPPQEAIQPINRPSTSSSNNQGVENEEREEESSDEDLDLT